MDPAARFPRRGLWVKREDRTDPDCTVGAARSHHVLATALFGRRAGLGVLAGAGAALIVDAVT